MSELHKFLFEGLPVRGMLVRLTDSWRDLLARRAVDDGFPEPVRVMLGEMSAAACLMQANIKFDGALILQVQGDGPVKLAVAEARSDLTFRATATVVGDVALGAGLAGLVNLHGQGRCAITLDPSQRFPGQQPYQGIVPLHGDHREPLVQISQALEHYMLQSEQLDTRLILAANDHMAAGLLIQRLPIEGQGNLASRSREGDIGLSEAFNRIAHLAASLTREELLTLDADTVLRRLFWEEDLRRFEPLAPKFGCSCSRERVANMLRSLGEAEAQAILAEQGAIQIQCEFCGAPYLFDAVDVPALFSGDATPPESKALH